MKRKLLTLFLVLATVLCLAFGLSACQTDSAGGTNGTYYLYVGENLDKSQYITLNGGKWTDDDNAGGTFTLNGTSIVFYAEVFGSNEEMFSGTLSNGVLKISVFGAPMTYCKEGVTPSGGNQSNTDNPTPPTPSKTEYTVTYNANGGMFANGGETYTQKAVEGSTLSAPTSPTRTASAFGGWSLNKNGGDLWKFATDTVTGDITLYAVWQERSAEIISVDGATIDEKAMTVNMLVNRSTDSVSLSNKIVCSSDSVWKLYYDKLGQTEIPTKIAASKTGVLADGDNVFYIVVTSSNGSQVNVYELTVHRSYSVPVTYYDNKTALLKTDYAYTGYEYTVNYTPNITGYTFNSWKTQSGSAAQTTFILYSPVSFYANCTANTYTATLNVNGGNAISNTKVTVTYDKSYSFTKPTREGYTFLGWYYGSTQITSATGASLENWTYTADRDITAKWQANDYTLTLSRDVTSGGTVSGSGDYAYGSKVTITASTNTGYTFLGWYDKSNKQITTNLSYTFTMGLATTYTAKWIACPVTIERTNYGGTVSGLEKTVVGTQATVTAKSYSGYTWVGWYNGETVLTKELSYTFTMTSEAVTYTAKWSKVTVSRSDNSAGTVTSLTGTYKVGDEATITATTNLGYTFLGWYNGETVLTKELSYTFTMPAENVTYRAKWEVCGDLTSFTFTSTETTCVITGVNDKTVTELVVPEYVTSINSGAFSGCSSLESITIPFVGDSVKASTDTYQYALGYIFGTSSYTGGTQTTQYYYGSTSSTTSTTYYIPTTLKSVTVTGGNILFGAFYNCRGLTSITISDGVTSIGGSAFYNCSELTSITIPNGVTYIGNYAFSGCSGLTSVNWNAVNCTYAGGLSFSIFMGCDNLATVTFGENVTNITNYAFCGCSLLTSITIPDSVTTIGNYAFYHCSGLTSVTIGNSVTLIGEYAFRDCSGLTSVVIPDSVTSIGSYAFYNCSGLTSIIIPDSVTSIGNSAFYVCSGLTSVNWNAINCTEAGGYDFPIFRGCNNLTTVIIGDNVTNIPEYAFKNCSGLTSITIPNSVTSIGSYAFSGCSKLTSITVDENNTVYKSENNCLLSKDGKTLVLGCKTSVIPDSVTTIGSYAFYGCSGLTSVVIPDSVTSIGSSAFEYCSGLTSVVIPDSVTSIGSYAFRDCSGLTSVTIGNGVTAIGTYAFRNCSGLTSITFNGTMAEWNRIEKGSYWNSNTGNYTVYCTDGNISK